MDLLPTTYRYRPANINPLALERRFLRQFFVSTFDLPLVILEAESGYGKTTTLSSISSREGLKSRWLTLHEVDSDLNYFVHDLLQTLYCCAIPLESAVLELEQAVAISLAAIRELSISTLILDNYEVVVESDAINRLMETIIEDLPPYTRVLIATEKPSPLRRGSRRHNRSAKLTANDLCFDVDDVSQYFLKVHNYQLTAEEATYLVEQTAGRPVLINLLGQLTRNLPSYLKIDWKKLPIGPEPEQIKLLLREILRKLPRSLARVVSRLADLQELSYEDDTPLFDLLEALAKWHCLVHSYGAINDDDPINVPHNLLVKLSTLI